MATVTIYGASDDLVEVYGIEGADEFTLGNNDSWTGVLEGPKGETAVVYVDYRQNGCWTVALGLWEEGFPLPEWPVQFTYNPDKGNDYGVFASIEVPDGTTIRELKD